MTIRRYRESAAILLASLNRQLPVGAQAVTVSRPEPYQTVDIDASAGADSDLDEYMARLGYEFVESAPATSLSQAASSVVQSYLSPTNSFDLRDVIVFDHFLSGNADLDEHGWMGWREFKTGTGNDISYTGVAGHPGICRINGGTGISARAALALGDDSGVGGRIVLSANPVICETLLRFPAATDFAQANALRFMLGLGVKWGDNTELDDGVYFRFTPGTDSFWSLVTAQGAARTVRASTVAPSTNWVRLGFSATSTAVQFYLNGAAIGAPLAATLPTIGNGFGVKICSNGGVGARVDIDYVMLTQVTSKEGA